MSCLLVQGPAWLTGLFKYLTHEFSSHPLKYVIPDLTKRLWTIALDDAVI